MLQAGTQAWTYRAYSHLLWGQRADHVQTEPMVHVHDLHTKAEATIQALQNSGLDMKNLSVVGKR
jgi:hypothetical protein